MAFPPPPPGATLVSVPFGNEMFSASIPNNGTLINYSGVGLAANKLQELRQLDAYMVEPYSELWGEDDQSIEAHYLVPWTNNAPFKAWAEGYSYNSFGTLRRIIPAQHPKYPWMYCTEARLVKGEGAIGFDPDPAFMPAPYGAADIPVEMIAYFDGGSGVPYLFLGTGKALWRLTYRALPYPVIDDDTMTAQGVRFEYHRFCERIETQAVDQLPVPGSQLAFIEGPKEIKGKVIDSSGHLKRFPTRALTYRWHGVPDVPEDAIDKCLGTVNSVVFDNQWTSLNQNKIGGASKPGGYPVGTLLCEAPRRERKRNAVGRVVWTLEYLFLYRPSGWNNFPAPDGKLYAAAYRDGTPEFQSADHNTLFQIPAVSKLYQGDDF